MTRVKLLLTAFALCTASATLVHAQGMPTAPTAPKGTTSTGAGTMSRKPPAGAPNQSPKAPTAPKAPGGTKPPTQPGGMGGSHHHHLGLHHHHMHHLGGGMGGPKTPMKK